jgi:hypothetical protein
VDSEHIIPKEVEYTFALARGKLLGAEYLYVSDRRHKDHYRLGHPENEGESPFNLGGFQSQQLTQNRCNSSGLRGDRYDLSQNLWSHQTRTGTGQAPLLED